MTNQKNAVQQEDEKEEKIKSFSELLESMDTIEEKKKHLWKEAYENALNDRLHAGLLLTDLMQSSIGNASNHTLNGPVMTKYIERMSKSNDQILRLAELIAKEEQSEELSVDDIFNKIKD